MRRSLYALIAILLISDSLPGKGEMDRQAVLALFREDKYEELDKTADAYRSETLSVHNYHSNIERFYAACEPTSQDSDDIWNSYRTKLENWQKARPTSVAVYIELARFYLAKGFRARGKGRADEVTADGWKELNLGLDNAQDRLHNAELIDEKDPEIYRLWLKVALGAGWAKDKVEQYYQRGIAVQRFYYPLYLAKADYLLPRWFGRPGEVESFADDEAAKLGGEDGDALYAVIATEVASVEGVRFLNTTNFSWDRLKRGLIAVAKNANDLSTRRQGINQLLYFALIAGDFDSASAVLDSWNSNSLDAQIWGSNMTINDLRDIIATAKHAKTGKKPANQNP